MSLDTPLIAKQSMFRKHPEVSGGIVALLALSIGGYFFYTSTTTLSPKTAMQGDTSPPEKALTESEAVKQKILQTLSMTSTTTPAEEKAKQKILINLSKQNPPTRADEAEKQRILNWLTQAH